MDEKPPPPNGNASSPLLHSLEEGLKNLRPAPESTAFIYRVPWEVRKGNEQHYTPTTVSIGPFHAGNPSLDAADGRELKFRALKHLVSGFQAGTTLESLILLLKEIEERARLCYAEKIDLSSDELVKMMLLDGCFILALLRGSDYVILVGRERGLLLQSIQQDLLLLENQLPFFVLEALLKAQGGLDLPDGFFRKYVFNFFMPILPIGYDMRPQIFSEESTSPGHLLELVLLGLFSPPPRLKTTTTPAIFPHLIRKRNISELALYGIKPKYFYQATTLGDIRFSVKGKGVLKMPTLYIQEWSTSLFKNLLALEKCSSDDQTKSCFTSYLLLMDNLVDSDKDVEQLISSGVIRTKLNDKQALVSLLNDLAANMVYSVKDKEYFGDVYKDLDEYCDSFFAQWRANFRRHYYESRWDILISMLLFFLTVTQTLFAVLSYKPRN